MWQGKVKGKEKETINEMLTWNEFPSDLYLSVLLIPPPLVWFLGNPKSISTSSHSRGASLFLPTQTKFHFRHSSITYFCTCWAGSSSMLSSRALRSLSVSFALPIQVCKQLSFVRVSHAGHHLLVNGKASLMVRGGSGRSGNLLLIGRVVDIPSFSVLLHRKTWSPQILVPHHIGIS